MRIKNANKLESVKWEAEDRQRSVTSAPRVPKHESITVEKAAAYAGDGMRHSLCITLRACQHEAVPPCCCVLSYSLFCDATFLLFFLSFCLFPYMDGWVIPGSYMSFTLRSAVATAVEIKRAPTGAARAAPVFPRASQSFGTPEL